MTKKSYIMAFLFLACIISGCAFYRMAVMNQKYGKPYAIDRSIKTLTPGHISFHDNVQPILERRCDVCHSCYDAPCQLKTTSLEGIYRGGTKQLVYDAARLNRSDPTRLFIDADSTEKWRTKDFHPVLNERVQIPDANKENSLIVRLLELKQENPMPTSEILPDVFDLNLNHNYICTTIEDYPQYQKRYPLWGMPYALPGLTEKEHQTLVQWISEGGQAVPEKGLSNNAARIVSKWETFLNGPSLKEKLMARYIYEHLFIAHIHFESLPDREFYRIVRSFTPPGVPVEEISTIRPYDDPGTETFYYRLRRIESVIVVKNHTVYHMNSLKMDRYRELFLRDNYTITELPGYSEPDTANPFKIFARIPANARYRFMLDDARFFVMGFIKGPVCRGQVALNVINDHFVVAFSDPDKDPVSSGTAFLAQVSDDLRLPSEKQSNMNILITWKKYRNLQQSYLAARNQYLTTLDPEGKGPEIDDIWDGEGTNKNALLTIFRHFDSASVITGFVGKVPKTAWIMDYPLFERIHYLLVAGFNVYGNLGHQAETRIHMDYLRMEGESNFLSYLPRKNRTAIWENWYEDARKESENYLAEQYYGLARDTRISFNTDDPKTEFLKLLLMRVGNAADPHDHLNRCTSDSCPVKDNRDPLIQKADQFMQRLSRVHGRALQVIPDVAFVHIVIDGKEKDQIYTLLRNKALSNNSMILREDRRRRIEDDSLTIVRGYVGSYPNSFVRIHITDLEAAIDEYLQIRDIISYFEFTRKYSIKRNHPDFWNESDWHYRTFMAQEPIEGGLFDMYRFHVIAETSSINKIDW